MEGKRFVLFDFDGVIADTFHIGHALARKVCVYLTESEYRKRFEGNIYDTHTALQALDHGDRCDHALDWWAHYAPEFKLHARPFQEMPELVKELARAYTICIVSSSHDDLIAHFIEKYGLQGAVGGVYGVDVNTRKDEKFESIFSIYGIASHDSIFITDTLGDINEAASVGLSSIGVTWGFQDKGTLARGNPFRIVDTPQELPEAVRNFFALEREH